MTDEGFGRISEGTLKRNQTLGVWLAGREGA